jgi:hypothetical protein
MPKGNIAPSQAGSSSAHLLAQIVFAAVVVASFAAFAITQRLKHTPTLVQHFKRTPYFSPTPSGHHKQERVSLLIDRTDHVTVRILDASKRNVATLVKGLLLRRYRQLSLRWNGREGSGFSTVLPSSRELLIEAAERGPPAPAGEYYVRVELLSQKHVVESPWSFKLVRHEHAGKSS